MIDFTEIRRIFEVFIADNFSTCPVQEENTPLVTEGLPAWIALYEKSSFSESTGMGETAYHLGGVLTIKIFTTLGTGTATARAIAKDLSDLFNDTDISGIMMENPELYSGPDDKHWYRHQLIIRYSTITGQESQC
jgi:hypothetical protein